LPFSYNIMGIELCQEMAGRRKAVAERICLVYVVTNAAQGLQKSAKRPVSKDKFL
jgi:hypothetical protein